MTASETWTNGDIDTIKITLKHESSADYSYRRKQLKQVFDRLIELGYYEVDNEGRRK